MEKFIAYIIATAVVVPTILLFIIFSTIVTGVAIQLYWVWFLVPIFPTLVPLTLAQAIGVGLFVNLFLIYLSRYDHEMEKKEGFAKFNHTFLKMGITYFIIFVEGYLVHLFI